MLLIELAGSLRPYSNSRRYIDTEALCMYMVKRVHDADGVVLVTDGGRIAGKEEGANGSKLKHVNVTFCTLNMIS